MCDFWLWNDFLPCFLCRVPGNDYLCRLHGNLTGGLFSCEVMQGKIIRPAMDAYRLSEADFVGLAFDTPVPFYDMPVSCGKPLEMGNVAAMMVMMPGELLGVKDVLCTVAGGDSMIDIGIMPGDALFFERACEYHSYDIVLAEIDGERLLKTFYIDENGDKWLVPANQKYQAIKLDGSMVVYFVGKLIGHLRSAPHQSVQSIVERLRAAESVSAASAESGSTASKESFLLLVTQPECADAVVSRLHELMAGKSKPRDLLMPVRAAVKAGVLRRPTWMEFMTEFGSKMVSKTAYYYWTDPTKEIYDGDAQFLSMADAFRRLTT